ncbi:hypothetical protein K466DRAFT_129439 [Polyporus arcularius HHB13444]|uniref:Uncharacterized protein n=1 Tax=Polyporus arcularius HHB13444 TaxID=1314778 RepID=A0A5C3PV35_9APHY|nr:hypothetical protein K466DRAFT_129439 [Polyporus arcularius HHB13444]
MRTTSERIWGLGGGMASTCARPVTRLPMCSVRTPRTTAAFSVSYRRAKVGQDRRYRVRHASVTNRQRVFVILKATHVVVVLGSRGPREILMDDLRDVYDTRRLRPGFLPCTMAPRARIARERAADALDGSTSNPKRTRVRAGQEVVDSRERDGSPHSSNVRGNARYNVLTSRAFDGTCPTPTRHAQRFGVGCGTSRASREGEARNESSCADVECRGAWR